MPNKTTRVKMLHGALGDRPTPGQPPQDLFADGVYDVSPELARQLIGSNLAVETEKDEKLRDGNKANSLGWGPEHPSHPDYESRDPKAKNRDPKNKGKADE